MKFTTVIVSALATLAAAAPTEKAIEKKAAFNLDLLNNLNGFKQVNLNYLFNVNALDLQLLGLLGQQNNLDILKFQGLFNQDVFNLQSLLQLQQLQDLLIFGQAGLLNGFDLAGLQFGGGLQLGLLDNLFGVDLQQFIIPSVVTQVQTVASQVTILKE